MIWAICEDLGVEYAQAVTLYQSRFFEDRFPEENQRFGNVVFTDAVDRGREASLALMRETMLSRTDLVAAVFIGGMEGVEIEYDMFVQFHPHARAIPVPAPGGAALELAKRLGVGDDDLRDVDFARMFHFQLAAIGAEPL
jgi:hypothetical protein